jgi:acyl-coenzyme A synthetase/AMP-(fatty) acid ligase
MNVQSDPQPLSIEDIISLYPKLYSAKKLDQWRCLFSDRSTVVCVEAGHAAVCHGIEDSLQRQRSYLAGCGRIDEVWESVEIRQFGSVATVKANYRLKTSCEVREGVDLLTLVKEQNGWKIFCLAYQQTLHKKNSALLCKGTVPLHEMTSEENMKQESHANLTAELSRQAALRPDSIAVYLHEATITFKQLEILTWKAATCLRQSGVKPGDVVALTFLDEIACLVTMLAVARIGSTVFSLPKNAPAMLRAEMAAGAKAQILVTDISAVDAAGLPTLLINLKKIASYPAPIDFSAMDKFPQYPWLIITGSGSTGRPKKIPVSHEQYRAQMSLYNNALAINPADRVASFLSLETVVTKERYFDALFSGAALVLPDHASRASLQWIKDDHVTVLWGTVIHAEGILRNLPVGVENGFGSLRVFIVGSSTVSDSLRKRIVAALTKNLYVYYGTNELGLATLAEPADVGATPGSVGRTPTGVALEVVDGDGKRVPDGATGLIRIKSPGLVNGYLDDAEATARAFKGGWFYPGDLGKMTPDNQLIYCGRADYMMIMNGVNIYPAEIEAVMTSHPAVWDAAAVPLRHSVHQDLPVCAVVIRDGERVSEKELLDYALQHLGSHGPRKILVLEKIPRNEQGKLIRGKLMQDIAGELGLEITRFNPVVSG